MTKNKKQDESEEDLGNEESEEVEDELFGEEDNEDSDLEEQVEESQIIEDNQFREFLQPSFESSPPVLERIENSNTQESLEQNINLNLGNVDNDSESSNRPDYGARGNTARVKSYESNVSPLTLQSDTSGAVSNNFLRQSDNLVSSNDSGMEQRMISGKIVGERKVTDQFAKPEDEKYENVELG